MRRLVAAVLLVVGAFVVSASPASAHVTTIACVSAGVWSIQNSEAGQSMTFTTDQGHSGSIGPDGSTTVNYSGTSLTVFATWDDGAENSATGTGDCTDDTTTTTSTTTTTTTTTTTSPETTTTTIPDTTTTTIPDTTTTTTTTSTTTSTTTQPVGLSITAISPVCLRDAPYIDVTFGNQSQFNGHTATVTFIAITGAVVGTETATYQAGATVRFVYPGAVVDAAGNPLDWPGWRFDGDEWVVDPTDAFLREGLTVVVEVNPTASDTVSYPPATPTCQADPPQNPPGGRLPPTR